MTGTVIYSQQDAVAVVAMNRPEALNGFTSELCSELVLAFERAQRDETVRAVVFTGEGRAFSAGADLKEGFVGERSTQGRLLFEYGPVLSAIANIPKPVIAAVPGFAAGIGMSFAMHSDLLVMAEESFLLSPFTTIGLMPDGGANWLLVRQLGYHRAYQLSIESERISAERCEELGIANRVVPAAELMDNAVEWGDRVCPWAVCHRESRRECGRTVRASHLRGTYRRRPRRCASAFPAWPSPRKQSQRSPQCQPGPPD